MRIAVGLLLVVLCVTTAHADASTTQRMLEQGVRALQRAERAAKIGDLAQSKRHAREAEQTFRAALDLDPRDPRAALLGAQAAVFASDLAGARKWAEIYRKRSPYAESTLR